MYTILEKIIVQTRRHVEICKFQIPESQLRKKALTSCERASFRDALTVPGISIIAEIKRASPSKGIICESFDPVRIAGSYVRGGAAAVSVLTDEAFFQGDIACLDQVADQIQLPLLRKDFIIDRYQIYEAKCHSAGAVLLLAGVLDTPQLAEFLKLTHELRMHALVEVHDDAELDKAVEAGADIIGINNRDLRTFTVDLQQSLRLADCLPDWVVRVSESGIQSRKDIELLEQAGFHACLIGESLMRHPDPAQHLKELRGA